MEMARLVMGLAFGGVVSVAGEFVVSAALESSTLLGLEGQAREAVGKKAGTWQQISALPGPSCCHI